jgi:hypothetical protein
MDYEHSRRQFLRAAFGASGPLAMRFGPHSRYIKSATTGNGKLTMEVQRPIPALCCPDPSCIERWEVGTPGQEGGSSARKLDIVLLCKTHNCSAS